MKKRAAAIIIKDDKILLIRRIKNGREYFVFPGGSVEPGEKIRNAVIREIKEELGIDIEIKKFLFKIIQSSREYNSGEKSYYYLVSQFSGIPKLGGPEKERMNENNQYYPEWKDLDKIGQIKNLYPKKAKTRIQKIIKSK